MAPVSCARPSPTAGPRDKKSPYPARAGRQPARAHRDLRHRPGLPDLQQRPWPRHRLDGDQRRLGRSTHAGAATSPGRLAAGAPTVRSAARGCLAVAQCRGTAHRGRRTRRSQRRGPAPGLRQVPGRRRRRGQQAHRSRAQGRMMEATIPPSIPQRSADLLQCPPQRAKNIPGISPDHRLRAAFRGIWLHTQNRNQGRNSVPDLAFWLVAGVGFEPT